MKTWFLVAGGIFIALAVVACGIGWVFSDTIEPRSQTVVTKVVASIVPSSSDEVDLEKIFAEIVPGATSVTESLSKEEATARSVGYSWETPLSLSVQTKK